MSKRRIFKYQDQDLVRETLRRFQAQQQQAVMNFPANPAITPIPAAANWIYSNYSGFTATLANSSTSVTAINIGTSMLAVGQVVTGAGIVNNPPTTIAAITSSTAITLSQNTTASASGTGVALTFQGFPGLQSPTFSNTSFYAQPAVSATDVVGCAWAIPEQQVLNASASFTPAPGLGVISLGGMATTSSVIQFQTASGTWTTIFTGSTALTWFAWIMADGGNLRITAGTGALTGQTYTFYRTRNPTYY